MKVVVFDGGETVNIARKLVSVQNKPMCNMVDSCINDGLLNDDLVWITYECLAVNGNKVVLVVPDDVYKAVETKHEVEKFFRDAFINGTIGMLDNDNLN